MTNMTSAAVKVPPRPAEKANCLVCGSRGARTFFELEDVPVLCNAPCTTREAALSFPTGRITLAFCEGCGLVFNSSFLPEAITYNQQYENSLHYSGRFDDYIRSLANDLVGRLGLYDKDIIEIGCGKGDFLAMLCELGGNRGIGFDPSFESDRLRATAQKRMQLVREFYSEECSHLPCDFLCCRHTLEHIPDPSAFLKMVRRALGYRHDTLVFFEVPNALYTLRHKGIWDIIYEHVSYFWSIPLSRVFAESGFCVSAVRETYGGQFICIEAMPDPNGSGFLPNGDEQLHRVAQEVESFGETFRSVVQKAGSAVEDVARKKQRAVVWGTGSKGVTLLNLLGHRDTLQFAVDINPHKQGKYVPGTGHPIVAPEFLSEYQPDVVFVMNPLYQEEIQSRLAEMSVSANLVTV